jgi:hypothetical protein
LHEHRDEREFGAARKSLDESRDPSLKAASAGVGNKKRDSHRCLCRPGAHHVYLLASDFYVELGRLEVGHRVPFFVDGRHVQRAAALGCAEAQARSCEERADDDESCGRRSQGSILTP